MKRDVADKIRALGAAVTPTLFEQTAAIVAPLIPGFDDVAIERDFSYGPHERHRFDIFRPHVADALPRPVIVFVHGGGFVRGATQIEGQPFYDSIGAWAVRAGAIGVTINYRLAPDHPWPAGLEDLAAALDAIQILIADKGGDPANIFLMGQSAGAAHVAGFVAMPALHRGYPIAGAVMLSGLYDALTFAPEQKRAYYGDDTALLASRSSLDGLVKTSIPCLFTISELDPTEFHQQGALLTERWFAGRSAMPHLLYLADHNHMSPAILLGGQDDWLGREIEAFVRSYRRPR